MSPRITDHAVLRYIERVHGVDVEKIRSQLLTDAVKLAARTGASKVKRHDCTLVLKSDAVVTVVV